MLKDLNINDFMLELSSSSPAPGGGSTAALSAAAAASLCSMVFNLTIGKKAYNEFDEELKNRIVKSLNFSEELKADFVNAMDRDTDVFLQLMTAFKLPKNSEEEKIKRSEAIQLNTKKALEVPMELAVNSFKLYEHIKLAAVCGNLSAVSDAGVSALMLQSAIEGAVLNVKINLTSIKDEAYKEKIRKQCEELLSESQKNREEILKIVNEKIEG